jgi:plasmid stabilization system protein ParE
MRLVYVPEARFDVLNAVTHYESCEEGLAAEFYAELKKAEGEILEWPEFWGAMGEGYRRKLLKRFPYGIVYHELDQDTLEVVAVMHQKQKPDHWRDRKKS